MSRCVGGIFLLGEEEKEHLRALFWKAARFCGVRLITYCVMSNHFHVLVEVPAGKKEEITDAELPRLRRGGTSAAPTNLI